MLGVSEPLALAALSALAVSLVSFAGLAFIPLGEAALRRLVFLLVSLAAGALFGDAVIHLIPEALEGSEDQVVTSLWVLGGIFGFFGLEKFLRWRHRHGDGASAVAPFGSLNLIADGIHNLVDGMAIGAAYLAAAPVGVATTIAVAAHEVPQEIGDFGVLIRAGFTRFQALAYNFLSGVLAVGGAVGIILVGAGEVSVAPAVQALTAGMFLYIAGSDLVPDMQRTQDAVRSGLQLLMMAVGSGAMLLLTILD